jgi:hypothetical protein
VTGVQTCALPISELKYGIIQRQDLLKMMRISDFIRVLE